MVSKKLYDKVIKENKQLKDENEKLKSRFEKMKAEFILMSEKMEDVLGSNTKLAAFTPDFLTWVDFLILITI